MGQTSSRYGQRWSREELILAFDLYCRIPFGQAHQRNPKVQAVAEALDRTPAAVARKLGNFGALDPELRRRNVGGLPHTSRLDQHVWDEFHTDWNALTVAAAEIAQARGLPEPPTGQDFTPPDGDTERTATRQERIHQDFFRAAVLSSYDHRCCVTGLPVQEALIASHIVPWSADRRFRTDPTNGLCLSATFDRLFDRGLMMVDDGFRIRLSGRLRDHEDPVVQERIAHYNNATIHLPHRFQPLPDRLAWHRENVFQP